MQRNDCPWFLMVQIKISIFLVEKHIIWYFTYLIKRPKYSNDEKKKLKWVNLEEELKECSSKKFYLKSKTIKRKHT